MGLHSRANFPGFLRHLRNPLPVAPAAPAASCRRADTIHAAQAAGLLTYTLTSEGRPTDLQLSPEVAFSLNIVTELHSAMLLDPE